MQLAPVSGPAIKKVKARGILAIIAVLAVTVTMNVHFASPAMAAAAGCTITMDNPHFSSGANGVIAKARVTCMTKRTVKFEGTLGSGPLVGPHPIQASNTETRVVDPAVRPFETFYIPAKGKPGLKCVANSYYAANGKITVNGQTDRAVSNRVLC